MPTPVRRWPMRATAAKRCSSSSRIIRPSWWWRWGARASSRSQIDADQYPQHSGDGRQAANRAKASGLSQAQVDRRAAQRLDQERAGVPAIQHERATPRASGVQARVPGAEPAQNVRPAGKLSEKVQEKPKLATQPWPTGGRRGAPVLTSSQEIGSPPWMPGQVRHDKFFCRANSLAFDPLADPTQARFSAARARVKPGRLDP